jgi:hypothetical protein
MATSTAVARTRHAAPYFPSLDNAQRFVALAMNPPRFIELDLQVIRWGKHILQHVFSKNILDFQAHLEDYLKKTFCENRNQKQFL